MILLLLTLFLPTLYISFFYYLLKVSKKVIPKPKNYNLCTLSQIISKEYLVQIPLILSIPIVTGLMLFYLRNLPINEILYSISLVFWIGVGLGFYLLAVSISLNGTRYHRVAGNFLVTFFFSGVYCYFFSITVFNLFFGVFGVVSTTIFVVILVLTLLRSNNVVNFLLQYFLFIGLCLFMFICLVNFYYG